MSAYVFVAMVVEGGAVGIYFISLELYPHQLSIVVLYNGIYVDILNDFLIKNFDKNGFFVGNTVIHFFLNLH